MPGCFEFVLQIITQNASISHTRRQNFNIALNFVSVPWLCTIQNTSIYQAQTHLTFLQNISQWLISNVSYFFRKGKAEENVHTSRSSCPEVFLKIWENSRGKHLCQSVSFNKFAGLRLCHKYFPVNLVKISRTPFLRKTSRGCLYSSSVLDTPYTWNLVIALKLKSFSLTILKKNYSNLSSKFFSIK